MSAHGWDYSLVLFTADGVPVGRAAIDVDVEPLCQWARLLALRVGAPPGAVRTETEPVWHAQGEPYVGGIRIRLSAGNNRVLERVIDTGYFRPYARAATGPLVYAGGLLWGAAVLFVARATRAPDARRGRLGLLVVDTTSLPRVESASLLEFLGDAEAIDATAADEVPLFVPRALLGEIARLAGHASPNETGGGLVGRLWRDRERQTVFVTATRQVAAEHTEASSSRLLFTAETWRAMRASLAEDESLVGWWHSHPAEAWLAANEGAAASETAPSGGADTTYAVANAGAVPRPAFFSEQDAAVHRVMFPAAHQIALVVDVGTGGERPITAFGWHAGHLRHRGYFVAGMHA